MKKEEAFNYSIDELKSMFKEYLHARNDIKETTKNTHLSSAFYLVGKIPYFKFIDLLFDDDFERKAKSVLKQVMQEYSKSNDIENGAKGYNFSHLNIFRNFLLGYNADVKVSNSKKSGEGGKKSKRKSSEISIPNPCAKQVEHYLAKWKTLPNYTAQEDSLNKLFWQLYPRNDDINDVLAKTAILNDFYSTNIFSTYTVAKHIVDLDIDDRLAAGDLTVVNDIAKVEINGSQKNLYSFATKYCSHHNDKIYPIFDRYVERVLLYFRDKDGFFDFKKPDLKNCIKLCEIIKAFQAFYNLKSYTLKEMDKYMWLLGKEYMPNSYSHR